MHCSGAPKRFYKSLFNHAQIHCDETRYSEFWPHQANGVWWLYLFSFVFRALILQHKTSWHFLANMQNLKLYLKDFLMEMLPVKDRRVLT